MSPGFSLQGSLLTSLTPPPSPPSAGRSEISLGRPAHHSSGRPHWLPGRAATPATRLHEPCSTPVCPSRLPALGGAAWPGGARSRRGKELTRELCWGGGSRFNLCLFIKYQLFLPNELRVPFPSPRAGGEHPGAYCGCGLAGLVLPTGAHRPLLPESSFASSCPNSECQPRLSQPKPRTSCNGFKGRRRDGFSKKDRNASRLLGIFTYF